MKTLASLFISLLAATLAAAQASSDQTGAATSTPPATAPAQTGSETSRPAPEMERLIKMWEGRWSTVERFEPSDEMPQGKQDQGAETMRPGPGGLSLIGDYESHGAFFGHLVVTWIPQERIYKSLWFDRTQPGVSISTGRWEGEKLVFTAVDETTGKKMLMRDTYSDITPTSFTDTLESGPVGGPMKKILTVKYTKLDHATLQKGSCDAALTPGDRNECSGQEFRRADAHLNVIYRKLIASTETGLAALRKRGDAGSVGPEIQKPKAAELASINDRDLHGHAAQEGYEGGSIRPTIRAIGMTTLTNHRIRELKAA